MNRALALLVLVTPLPAQSGEALVPMSVDDLLQRTRYREVRLSPDGRHVLYEQRVLDWDENEYASTIYLATEGGPPRQYLGEAGASELRFSPAGGRLGFLREVDEANQIFVIRTDGGEAVRLTSHEAGIESYRWSGPDSIVFIADDPRTAERKKEHARGADAFFVDEAPHGKHEARFRNLWRIDLKGRQAERVTSEKLVIEELSVSPDGARAAIVARPDTRTNYVGQAELYLVELASGTVRRLTTNDAPETKPVWSPDGARLAYRAPSDSTFDLRSGYFWVMDPETKHTRRLEGQNQGEVAGEVAWSADGASLLYNELRGVATSVFSLDVETDRATQLTGLPGTLHVQAFSSDATRMAYTYETTTQPVEVYVASIDGSDARRITDSNERLPSERALSTARPVRWTSSDGFEIEGLFYPAIDGGERPPLIMEIHGGPAGVSENRFGADLQVLAGLGYAVLAPNYRGSSGYGDELLRGLMGQVGDGEHDDVMSGVDYAIENLGVDPDRLGVRGWSWGGVSSGYLITQTDRFSAASVGAMVANWAAETGPGFNFDVSLWYIGGTPWTHREEWARRSAITHVANVTTPTIIFHGAKDETSSANQSLMFFTALRDIGRAPVRYMKLPRQRHGIREPRLERAYLHAEIEWFKRHVDGVEWTPPARPTPIDKSDES